MFVGFLTTIGLLALTGGTFSLLGYIFTGDKSKANSWGSFGAFVIAIVVMTMYFAR